jgi:FAD/FMN-containing dehydrogenase
MIESDLEKIVGRENVLTGPETLQEYSGGGFVPRCAVRPANTGELQDIVRFANEKKVPLVPVSSGPPHFRGGTSPAVEGAAVVDLSRMNKIIRVNAANRVAIVEPGVTFSALQAELAKSGLSAYLPLAPRQSKSVLASILERDPILMPGVHFDSTDPMLCVEIVFGSGDRLRTGEAAGPDTLEEQWEIGKAQISPFGPTQMDPQRLVSGAQGTIGIVSWMSLKCRSLSELNRAFLIPSATLEPLIELSYRLTRIRFTGEIFILNGLNLAGLTAAGPNEIASLRDSLPAWAMFVSCEGYGPLPQEKVAYLEADLKELAAGYGLEPQSNLAGVDAEELAGCLSQPSPEPYWKLRPRGAFREVFFLITQGKTPALAAEMHALAGQRGFPEKDIGVYIQPVVQGTSCHCEFDLYFDPADQGQTELAGRFELEAVSRLEERGAFFSRPYRGWAEAAYRRAGDTAAMQQKVKDIFDPNGILNPGKLCF